MSFFLKAARERGIFDSAVSERLIEQEGAFDRKLWGVLNIELWFRTFIDGGGNNCQDHVEQSPLSGPESSALPMAAALARSPVSRSHGRHSPASF
jgi:hypothetical protein